MTNIFPIPLNERVARDLVRQYRAEQFARETMFVSSSAVYSYWGKLKEDGSVDLSVSYSFNDVYIEGSGAIGLEPIPNAFSPERFESLKQDHMVHLACEVYEHQQMEIQAAAIRTIAKQMFGDQFKE